MKNKINLVIDAIMLILAAIIAGLGLLIKYVLLPGFKRNEIYGKDIDLLFMGYDRHWWGHIHFILSLILISLVVLHIILHWKQIKAIFCKMFKLKTIRYILGIFVLFISLFFAGSVLLVKPEQVHFTSGVKSEKNITVPKTPSDSTKGEKNEISAGHAVRSNTHPHKHNTDIKGSMTLEEIATMYNVSASDIKKQLNIPDYVSDDSRAGRLKREFHFEMDELRDAVHTLEKKN